MSISKLMDETYFNYAINRIINNMCGDTTKLCLLNCDRTKLLITRHNHKHYIEVVEAERQAFKIRADFIGLIGFEDNDGVLLDILMKFKIGDTIPRIRKLKADIPFSTFYDPELKTISTRIEGWNKEPPPNMGLASDLFEWPK
jgi:hypothetical protein